MTDEGSHHLRHLLKQAHQIFSYPRTSLNADEYNLLSNVIKNIDYFNDYLEPPANMHDFSHRINQHIKFEVHQHGKVLISEGDINDKFYIVLQGYTYRLVPRPFEDIEKDVRALVPMAKRKASTRISILQPVIMPSEDKPNYLKHTKNTNLRKGHSRKSHFNTAINIAIQEATEAEAMKNGGKAAEKMKSLRSSLLKFHIDNITIESLMGGKGEKKETAQGRRDYKRGSKMRRSVFLGKERNADKRRSTMIRSSKRMSQIPNQIVIPARRESVEGIEEISDEEEDDDSDDDKPRGDLRRKSRRESTSSVRKSNAQKLERRPSKIMFVRKDSIDQRQPSKFKRFQNNSPGVRWADDEKELRRRGSGQDNSEDDSNKSRMEKIEALMKSKRNQDDDDDEDYLT